MSDQNFNGPVERVAARDCIEQQNNYSCPGELQPGRQKWMTKRYLQGKSFTAGEITLLSAVLLLFALRWPPFPASSSMNPILQWLLLLPVVLIAAQASACGIAAIPNTRSGIVRDINGHLFSADCQARAFCARNARHNCASCSG